MGLRFSYTLLAPLYDLMVAGATHPMRKASLNKLYLTERQRVLLSGIGSGLDLPLLPHGPEYTGIDLTPAMLRRAEQRLPSDARGITLQQGDVMQLPYEQDRFDLIIMHLILAVVPEPQRALQEAVRVLKAGGHILILDKFLRPGERALFRRLLNPLLRRVATRTDVVFEELLSQCPQLHLIEDTPAGMGGWFRHIILHKPVLQK
jgi:ubiquinone/menaquinone biosynthesis C-methylase UbiE